MSPDQFKPLCDFLSQFCLVDRVILEYDLCSKIENRELYWKNYQ